MVGGPVLDARPWNPFAVADNFSQFADFPATRPSGEAEYFPGCNMAMRKADFIAIGGFPDTKMPAGEDTLLCLNMAAHFSHEPAPIRFINAMRIRHIGRTTPAGFLKHQAFFGYCRASCGLKMTMKHRKLGRSVLAIPALVAKRYRYMLGQALGGCTGGLGNLPKILLISPLVLIGMIWWGWGFRKACREPIQPYSLLYTQED
jgi:GT2 family glycosyltransferase